MEGGELGVLLFMAGNLTTRDGNLRVESFGLGVDNGEIGKG